MSVKDYTLNTNLHRLVRNKQLIGVFPPSKNSVKRCWKDSFASNKVDICLKSERWKVVWWKFHQKMSRKWIPFMSNLLVEKWRTSFFSVSLQTPQTASIFEPRIFLLWGGSANQRVVVAHHAMQNGTQPQEKDKLYVYRYQHQCLTSQMRFCKNGYSVSYGGTVTINILLFIYQIALTLLVQLLFGAYIWSANHIVASQNMLECSCGQYDLLKFKRRKRVDLSDFWM